MAIKAIINNTEKEIEQIKNSDEQDIDYVYSRIGDTEVEGEPPISIKSIGGELANYRIYGNTVGGESVGDRTGNLFDGEWEQGSFNEGLAIGTPFQNTKILIDSPIYNIRVRTANICNIKENSVISFNDTKYSIYIMYYDADSCYTGNYSNWITTSPYIINASNVGIAIKSKSENLITPDNVADINFMLNTGSTPLPYEPYGYKVPVTVEGKNLFDFGEWSKNINANADNSLVKGIDGITITANSNDAFTTPYAYVHEGAYKIYVKPNTNYLLSWVSNNDLSGRVFIFKNGISDGTHAVNTNNNTTKYLLFGTDADTEFITLRFGVTTAGNTITYSKIMLNEGSTALPYEPYHAPVTTHIYLPEQIRKVGDESEYIDYGEQKLHRARKNLLQNTATSLTRNGVTFTVNSDGSVTCNGTASATIDYRLVALNSYSLPAGNYRLTGAPPTANYSSYYLRAWYNSSGSVKGFIDIGNGTNFSLTDTTILLCAIIIASQQVFNNVTFYPMIRKADIEDDTYEPYIENTGVDVTLPALSTIKGTNTFSVNTSIQPSNIYIKDNFDYKKVFTATRTIEDELPLNYRSIEDSDSTLKNYRIFGNTVGGESVGDRTGNLFDKDSNMNTRGTVGSLSTEPLTYGFPGTINEQSGTYFMDVLPGEVYTISMETTGDRLSISGLYHPINPNDYTPSNRVIMDTIITVMITGENVPDTYTFTVPPNVVMVAIYYALTTMPINFQIVKGSTALPYEPYGYRAPVTVSNGTDTLTTPIYLPESIKMVGDEAEYIDYAEQKQHRVRKNLWPGIVEQGSVSTTGAYADDIKRIRSKNVPIKPGAYTISCNLAIRCIYAYNNNEKVSCVVDNGGRNIHSNTFTVPSDANNVSIGLRSFDASGAEIDVTTSDFEWGQIEKGSEVTTYEPYIENTDLNVTLPALPTLPGTNVLSVGTAVQPSEVYIKGKIKEIN